MDLPIDFLNRMKKQLGNEFNDFCLCYDESKTVGLRVNTLKITKNEFIKNFEYNLQPIPWCENGFYINREGYEGTPSGIGNHPFHRAGLFYMQEPSAMAAAELLSPKQNDRVLDLCAAPGGKSTHLAALMNGGVLVSNEVVPGRAKILSENIERLGITNAIVTNENPQRLCAHFEGYFDRILVDAPCSGEGMFRKDPSAVKEWSVELTKSCAKRQLLILESAKQALKKGGELVYSTCTFSPEENEGVIENFLKTNNDFELIKTEKMYPHTHKCEGHFISKLLRKGLREENDFSTVSTKIDELKNIIQNNLFKNTERMGSYLWSLPDRTDLRGIKFLRCGLYLGEFKKNRFEPSHSLCMAVNDFCQKLNVEGDTLEKYLKGGVLEYEGKGWVAVAYKGYNLGLGKASDGLLKNHFPKNLRKF